MSISLAQQIEEVEYELVQRRRVYAGISYKNPARQSELDYHMARMQGVLRTLAWLQANEVAIKAALAPAQGEAA